ncbi:DRG regulatory protein Tma46 [Gracilaria domingensis]|nr:DRG regulatory protein Tma46 [Gracilaria domingensis]
MPPKKKKAEEQKKKIVEDKTFGLKNKKKSRKVQQYVETVKKQASQKVDGPRKRSAGAGSSSAASNARLAQMQARLAELELMNQPVKEKPKKMSAEEAERKRLEEEAEKERIRIANLPIEDQIEEERAKLTTHTPVTKELFLKWKEEKVREKKAEQEAKRAAAYKKMSKAERSRGQGLTGRQLFQSNAEIFVDDEEADDTVLKADGDYTTYDDENHASSSEVQPDASLFEGEAADGLPESAEVMVGDETLFT